MNKGETLSLGTFSATNKNKQMLPMKAVDNASVFIISLEPKNGSAIPNIAQLCLMSKE
jgi:anti-sigma-K factor RskA